MYRSIKVILKTMLLLILLMGTLFTSSCSLRGTGDKSKINSFHEAVRIKGIKNNSNIFNISSPMSKGNSHSNHSEPFIFNNKLEGQSIPEEITFKHDDCIDYIVNKDDTLFGICRKYQIFCPVGTAVKTVLALNHITDANNIKEGITIELPDKYFTSGIKYTIQEGDTLFSIAKKHLPDKNAAEAMTIIMKDNFMNSYEVDTGDELFIENGR